MAQRRNSRQFLSVARRTLAVGCAVALTVSLGTSSSGHDVPDGASADLAAGAREVTRGPAWSAPMRARNFAVVGHTALGGGGLNADVWEHRGYAYVGVWSGSCPATGVKVADVRNPRRPRLVSRLQNPAGTSAEDVVVRHVETPTFSGDLAVVGIQVCRRLRSRTFRGLQVFDVTRPWAPRQLARFRVDAGTVGCHEIDLVTRADGRVLAACANAFAELVTGADEVVLVDLTAPRRPRRVAGFAIGADLGVDPADNPANVGCDAISFAHSVRFTGQGTRLHASYWDFGTLRFRVRTDGSLAGPTRRTDIAPPDEDADNHSMTLARGGTVMVINPEDFSPLVPDCAAFNGWGDAHVYGTRGNRLLSTFSTPRSRSTRTDGFYSVHNSESAGPGRSQIFSSWYSDGVVWWSVVRPGAPRMRGQFVPPPTEDPTGSLPPVPLVWGVFPDPTSGLVFASDMNSGLWVLRPVGLPRL